MSPIWHGIKIWAITIFMNALLVGIGVTYTEGIGGLGLGVIFLFGGCFFTLPLLLLIVPIVSISCKLPYSISAKTAWMGSWFVLIICGYFNFLSWLWGGRFFSYTVFPLLLTGVASGAMIIAQWLTHKSFIKLNSSVNNPGGTFQANDKYNII
jgi:hypothetical protein